ncbi:MAG: hypothetical protein N4A33_05540 [Bacteriovoracaceae bacterium]|jgi:hypothetical protein|nr:hypothetical protein [Bacteriovoracaceae bacterium]
MRFVLLFILSMSSALCYVDLGVNYSYSKRKVDGVEVNGSMNGQAVSESATISANWAWYIWSYTALEFNYSKTKGQIVDTRQIEITDGSDTFTIKKSVTKTQTEVKGVGIRQSFAKKTAKIVPSLAIGYAVLTTSAQRELLVQIGSSQISSPDEIPEESTASSYATFSLRFQFTKLMGITLGAKAVMPDMEFEEAKNNMTYSAGLSWIF